MLKVIQQFDSLHLLLGSIRASFDILAWHLGLRALRENYQGRLFKKSIEPSVSVGSHMVGSVSESCESRPRKQTS